MSLQHADHEVRLRNANVPMRGHRLVMQQFDQATEILCDFYSAVAVSEFKVWTADTSRVRINMGSGWLTVGATQATAADLGAFTAGETRAATVEVTIPAGSGARIEALPLNIDLGV